jgi:HD-GYP domain-containing protein (c-di-GMP phosphodiesterase class II)
VNVKYPAVVTLASLTLAGCARYPKAAGHLIRTAFIADCLADLVGLNAHERKRIRLVTPVHDIGKLGVPDEVLLKPGKLNGEERSIIERHSTIGADLLAGSSDPLIQLASQVARHHHERFDGSGYPSGLVGANIPLPARVVAVADAFDAMTEPRVYRTKMTDDDANAIIAADNGTHFDPLVVRSFFAGFSSVQRARTAANEVLAPGNDVAVVTKFFGLTGSALGLMSHLSQA